MNCILSFLTLSSIICVHGQQSDKGTSMIPFPRIGRADPRFFMEGKRSGNTLSPGLIPFPRIGRSDGPHEIKRQLIPFPRVGKRPYWRVPMEPYPVEYDEYPFPLVEVPAAAPSNGLIDWVSSSGTPEEIDAEKRNAGSNPSNNNSNNGGMWFGPRLGRRKRSVETETSGERSHDTTMDTRMLLKILHNFNWAIVPIKGHPSHSVQLVASFRDVLPKNLAERRTFTPRLGRSSSAEEAPSGAGIHRRAEPYTPRLGRSREVATGDFDEETEQTHRYSRGGNDGRNRKPKGQSDDTNVGGVPFSPRLGRDHINPRLGRSSTDEHE